MRTKGDTLGRVYGRRAEIARLNPHSVGGETRSLRQSRSGQVVVVLGVADAAFLVLENCRVGQDFAAQTTFTFHLVQSHARPPLQPHMQVLANPMPASPQPPAVSKFLSEA